METGKTAFVTGAGGFIGSNLIRNLLNDGFRVKALVMPDENLDNISGLDIEILIGDLTKPDELKKILPDVDYVFHLAAIMGEGKRGYEFLKQVNIDGSKTLIDHYAGNGKNLKRFVFMSSLAAAGPSGMSSLNDEMGESNPVSIYGKSKLETENYLIKLQQKIPFTIIRLPLVYGPRSQKGALMLFKLINKGIQLKNVKSRFSVGFIDDISEGIIIAAEGDISDGKKYYIGEDISYSIQEIMNIIAKSLNKRTFKIIIPFRLLYSFCFIIEKTSDILGKTPALRRDSIKSYFGSNWCVNTDRAKIELKYKTKFPLEKGMRITGEWYKKNGYL